MEIVARLRVRDRETRDFIQHVGTGHTIQVVDTLDLYLHVSRLPSMARRTLELYTDLLSHLQSTANSPSGGWVM
jgi:hypothetical protein